ncbi:probable ATP-dependent DNA helicase HFM1 [Eurosta solidaginis]|uniref:probable ATP-dependent DNA helicase HFM1 n=1 Tax=Eurosta solidaginis TaxID=178769 RepID=UPI0035310871
MQLHILSRCQPHFLSHASVYSYVIDISVQLFVSHPLIHMDLKSFEEIPPPFCRIFEHYPAFNAVQSALLNVLLHTNKSVVLSAPTGSGKTVAFELAIVRLLLEQQQAQNISQLTPKAVYVAPIKALCSERFADWKLRFEVVGIQCLLITGDSELDELSRLRDAQVIITTPEKWDSLTRHWRDCSDAVSSVRLLLIDEVHLLNEDVRGPVLEAIVSRMHTIALDTIDKVLRIVVASATIPNVSDITRWIAGFGSNHKHCNKRISDEHVTQLVFSDSDRPVPLEKLVIGFNSCLRGFKFDLSLNYKLMEILRKYSECKATLIFCSSRKSAEMAANVLEHNVTTHFALSDQQKANLAQLAQNLNDSKLRKLIAHGIAFHHAGMTLSDRNLIEANFRQGNIMVLLCTNTLAMGVNLPAHLVVIKSTEYYHFGKMVEYPESTLLQMIGRAGRPQYDTKGVAVILTHKRNAQKYEALVDGKMPIESHLHKHLAEHLNSEIALGTINNLEVAMNWMRSTYLYVRSMQNPSHYGLDENMDKDIIENKLERMCLVHIQDLENAGLIKRNPENELDVKTTSNGKLMAKYYLCFETMKLFTQIRGDETYLKILDLVVRCREFSEFTLRVNEKRILNALNDTPLRFPRAGRIKTREDKIACLLQAILGNVTIASPTLAQESLKMLRIADRIAKCLLEYMRLSEHPAYAFQLGRYKALLHTVTIAKCFHAKLWENSEYAAKQLQKIGAVYSAQLVNAGKTSLKSLRVTDARTIEAILNKSYPFGDEILQNLQQTFPEYICSLQMVHDSQSMLQISVQQVNESFIYRGTNAMIIVGDSSNQLLLFIEDLDALLLEYGCFAKTIKLPNPHVEKIYAHVIHATLVGVDVHETLVLKEPIEDANLEIKTKRSRKRKQATLNETNNKKMKPSSKICYNAKDDGAKVKKKTNINLQSFTFSKSKILNDSTIAKFEQTDTTITEVEQTNTTLTKERNDTTIPAVEQYESIKSTYEQVKRISNISSNNYVELTNDTVNDNNFNNTSKKSNNDSTLVQAKLTKFFKQKKCSMSKSFTIPSCPMLTTKQLDMQFENRKEGQFEEKKERDSTTSFTLQARTPDLNEISAFLETQKSQTLKGLTERQNVQEICERSQKLQQTQEIPALPGTQTSMCAISNGKQYSIMFDTPKSTEKKSNDSITSQENADVMKQQTNENMDSNDTEPLDLTRQKNIQQSVQRKDEAFLKTTWSTIDHLYVSKCAYITKNKATADIAQTSTTKLNHDLCGLDLSCQITPYNDNMSWRDDNTKEDDASIMSIAPTNKSADSITNSPKNIENFLLCYKVALAFVRLNENERNIDSFKDIYQRIWHTSKAIDYITAKLSNSGISRSAKETVPRVCKRKTKPSEENKNVLTQPPNKQRRDIPLNLAKRTEVETFLKDKENIFPISRSTETHLKQIHDPKTGEPAIVAPSKTRRNPFRLQIMNDIKKKRVTAKTINNEIMNSVLNMKCSLVENSEKSNLMSEEPESLTSEDFAEIDRELALNETQKIPNMSFKEYCDKFLQSANKKGRTHAEVSY